MAYHRPESSIQNHSILDDSMKLRIAILGIGLLAGTASLNAQTPIKVSFDTPGSSSSAPSSGPIKVGFETAPSGGGGGTNSTRPTNPGSVNSPFLGSGQQGGSEPTITFAVNAFPNPAVDVMYIEVVNDNPDEYIRIFVYNSDGHRVPVGQERSGNLFMIEVNTLQPGRYLLEVLTNSNEYTQAFEVIQ